MLSNSNNNRLLWQMNIYQEHLFLYQRWQEMLESRTLDMYQYDILNSYVACLELQDVIEKTLSGLFTSKINVQDMLDETFDIIKTDDSLEQYNEPLKKTLFRILKTKIDAKQRNDAVENKASGFYISLNRIRHQLMTPLRILKNEYMTYLLKSLEDDIEAADYNKIEKHISMVISQCIAQGWSTRGLFLLSKHLEGELSPREKWLAFTGCILFPAAKNIDIYYNLKLDNQQKINADSARALTNLGLTFKRGSEIMVATPEQNILHSKIKAESFYITVTINTFDIYSAVSTAINTLNKTLSVATFYNIINYKGVNVPIIVAHDVELDIVKSLSMTDVFKTYDYVDGNNSVFNDTRQILNNLDKAEIMNRLHAAFSYTNLSRTSLFQETKYISLWIAVESVMRTGHFPDIISHIKYVLPEILCTRYIYRIIRNFTEDCKRCGFKYDDKLDINMDSDNKKQLAKDIISIFRDSERYNILEKRCSNNELLEFRCKEIHVTLTSSTQIIEKIEHYTKKVRWHIQRLYRIRNEITHSAFQENRSLVIYIEHLYTYLAQMVSEVVYCIEHKESGSIEEAFETILLNYNIFIELVKNQQIPIHEILPDGVIEFPHSIIEILP